MAFGWQLRGGAAVVILLLAGPGCGGKKPGGASPSAQGDRYLAELGNKALEDKDWEEARGYFKQLIDTYPRSPLAAEARLGIGDSYFNQRGGGNLVLATAEYRDFLTFYPNHPRADYAQFQIASAHFKQIHGADRDQEPTRSAVAEFSKLIELYRNSRYAEEGRKLLQECYERLAEHEFTVGRFYLKQRKACRGAIARFKTVLEQYPTYSRNDEVYFHLGEAFQLCDSPLEAMPYYKQLIDNYPKSALKEEAEQRLVALQVQANPKGNGVPRLP